MKLCEKKKDKEEKEEKKKQTVAIQNLNRSQEESIKDINDRIDFFLASMSKYLIRKERCSNASTWVDFFLFSMIYECSIIFFFAVVNEL